MSVSTNLKKLRLLYNLTQQQTADKLHMSQNAYSLMETGKSKIDEQRIIQLAAIFQVNVSDLLTGNFDHVLPATSKQHIRIIHSGPGDKRNDEEIKQLVMELTEESRRLKTILEKIDEFLESLQQAS